MAYPLRMKKRVKKATNPSNLTPSGSTTQKPRVYSYIRYSSPRQKLGDSRRRQLDATREWATKRGLEVDEGLIMQDEGLSGFKGEHKTKGALGSFLKDVEAGRVPSGSILVVESLDRLSRETVSIALASFLQLLNAGSSIVTLADGAREYTSTSVADNPTELLISIVVMWRAHEESRTKQYRALANWQMLVEKARRKEPITERCPGWLKIVGRNKIGNRKEGGKFAFRSDRLKVVRTIIKLRRDGHGLTSIAQALNEKGHPTWNRARNGWADSTVKAILTSRALVGDLVIERPPESEENSSITIEGYYPAVISEGEFDAIQGMMRIAGDLKGRKGGKNKDEMNNLFTGFITCGHCGGPMHFGISKTKTTDGTVLYVYPDVSCDRARRRFGCLETGKWRYDEIENAVLQALAFDLEVQDLVDPSAAQKATVQLQQRRDDLVGQATGLKERIHQLGRDFEGATGELSLQRRIDQLLVKAEKDLREVGDALALVEGELSEKLLLADGTDEAIATMSRMVRQMRAATSGEEKLRLRVLLRNRLMLLVRGIKVVTRKRWRGSKAKGKRQIVHLYEGPRLIMVYLRNGKTFALCPSKELDRFRAWNIREPSTFPSRKRLKGVEVIMDTLGRTHGVYDSLVVYDEETGEEWTGNEEPAPRGRLPRREPSDD